MGFLGYLCFTRTHLTAPPTPVGRMGLHLHATHAPMLQDEVPHNFQYTDIQSMAGWLHFAAGKGARSLTEVDCKKQFDNIKPRNVLRTTPQPRNPATCFQVAIQKAPLAATIAPMIHTPGHARTEQGGGCSQ